MQDLTEMRALLKRKLQERRRMLAGWVSFAQPSITEIFSRAGFDFIAIDMEHSTISLEQAQRIVAASQSAGVPCIPRPVSHSNDYFKPLLDSGADGLLVQMVETRQEVEKIIGDFKYPPNGKRTYGVNRAQCYGFDFDSYVSEWNRTSSLLLQIESKRGLENIEQLLEFDDVEGVMIGPLDMAGSLGFPGQPLHPAVIEATGKVIEACRNVGKSCGTQIADVSSEGVTRMFDLGYTFIVLGSDLFALCKWAQDMEKLMSTIRTHR